MKESNLYANTLAALCLTPSIVVLFASVLFDPVGCALMLSAAMFLAAIGFTCLGEFESWALKMDQARAERLNRME